MITVNLSIDQLADAVRNLNEGEKDQIRQVLYEKEYQLTPLQEQMLMERDEAYERGEMKTYTIDEVKQKLNNAGAHNHWDDEEFVAEMDRRVEEYRNGTVKGVSWEEVKRQTREITG